MLKVLILLWYWCLQNWPYSYLILVQYKKCHWFELIESHARGQGEKSRIFHYEKNPTDEISKMKAIHVLIKF